MQGELDSQHLLCFTKWACQLFVLGLKSNNMNIFTLLNVCLFGGHCLFAKFANMFNTFTNILNYFQWKQRVLIIFTIKLFWFAYSILHFFNSLNRVFKHVNFFVAWVVTASPKLMAPLLHTLSQLVTFPPQCSTLCSNLHITPLWWLKKLKMVPDIP